VQRAYPALQYHFAKGSEIDPEKVEPALEFNRRAYLAIRSLSVGELILVSAGVCGFRPALAVSHPREVPTFDKDRDCPPRWIIRSQICAGHRKIA
jgi:hypothetical protein